MFTVRNLERSVVATFEAPSVDFAASYFASRHATLADIADGTMELVVIDGDRSYSVTAECEITWSSFVNGEHQEETDA